ncbi:hypothetical protein PF011_g20315 [Phytophthora fragariae]|uniref:Uncharacterized protein n=1 Tax=Phytophthora fragariae TaxID=53985 RepID=A0A6A3IRP1_9STRA|nr:hypothetical protein PF011_g20315 [Phytophthora fragariae]
MSQPPLRGGELMVALLDASASDFVRGRHCLSSREDFPRVYKIVEGQEKLHVKNAVEELCSKGCKTKLIRRAGNKSSST